MKYTMKNFESGEIKDLLELFTENILCKPIIESQKYYEKYTRGFRINKLHKYIIDKIYCDEILKREGSQLENYLVNLLKANFEGTKIEEIVDKAIDYNVFEIALELQREILCSNLLISPDKIFMLAEIELDIKTKMILKDYYQLIISEHKRIEEKCEKQMSDIYERKIDKIESRYENSLSELALEKNKSKILEELEKQKEKTIDSDKEEKNILIDKIKQLNAEIEMSQIKLQDFETNKIIIKKLQEEVIKFKKQIVELEENIDIIEEHYLSPEVVRDMCKEVLEDIKSEVIQDDDFYSNANNIFSEDETIRASWEKLSVSEEKQLSKIIKKMESNYVESNDIGLLDAIENNILYKYMLIKGLKVIFYKYLEQETANNSIDHKFNKS